MYNKMKFSIILPLAILTAACSQQDEPAAVVEESLEQAVQGTQEMASDVTNNAVEAGNATLDNAKSVMEDTKGQVGEIANDAEEMATDAMDDAMDKVKEVKEMSEEELKKQALKKPSINH